MLAVVDGCAQRLQNLQVVRSFEAMGHNINVHRDGKWVSMPVLTDIMLFNALYRARKISCNFSSKNAFFD